MRLNFSTPISILAALLVAIGTAQADDLFWNGGDGDWMDPANWNTNEVPTSLDSVTVSGGTSTIFSEDHAHASSLSISADENAGVVVLSSGATLSVGSLVSLGNDGTEGHAHVHGSWTAGAFIVGNTGLGELNLVQDGESVASLTVTGGTLQLGGAADSNGYLNIGAAGFAAGILSASEVVGSAGSGDRNVAFLHDGDHTFGAALKGNLLVHKDGNGTTTLTGTNSYTKTTTIAAGTLEIGNGVTGQSSNLGTGEVENHGTLRFNTGAGDTVTVANTIQGGGTLEKRGSGTVVLTGANTHTGGTVIRSGTLRVQGGSLNDGRTSEVIVGAESGDSATLELASGSITTDYVAIANHGESTGTVNVSGGSLSADVLDIGNVGDGSMTVSGGSVHAALGATVGNVEGSSGVLAITDGGVVTVEEEGAQPGILYLGVNEGSSGTLKMGSGGTAGTLNAGGVVGLGGDATVEFNHTGNLSFSPELGGSLAVHKMGSGTTTLTSASFYSGKTRVHAGTLVIESGSVLTGDIEIEGGTFLVKTGVSVIGAVKLLGGSYARELNDGEALEGAIDVESEGGTRAVLLDGELSANATLQSSFSETSLASNDEIRMSDVFSFSGVPVVDVPTGQTDLFVLQMEVTGLPENAILGWLNPENVWVNAVLGNIGGVPMFVNGAYTEGMPLGTYGRDGDKVWAVVNHNSDFSVIPEPSSVALIVVAGVAALYRRRRE